MTNTLYLPELRDMLAHGDAEQLQEFCVALHPGRTAEFMEGLTSEESWAVLQHTDPDTRHEIFRYFDDGMQIKIIEESDRQQIGTLIADLPPDDRVDILNKVDPWIVEELLPLVPEIERRDILRLRSYAEGTAGAIMTTEFAKLPEGLSVTDALDLVGRQAADLETIYYLYIVDHEGHLRGLVSARELLSAMGKPGTLIDDLMERDLVTVQVMDDQEDVADRVARYNLHAIPVVDDEYQLVGIITHDDVIDVVRQEAAEDIQMIGAVQPLRTGYLETGLARLIRERAMWLTVLFVGAMGTIWVLSHYQSIFDGSANGSVVWLVIFLPLIISSGGNSGTQSAALIISALSTGDVTMKEWGLVVRRDLVMGMALGVYLGLLGAIAAFLFESDIVAVMVVSATLVLVVTVGTLCGSLLPLLFRGLGLDPAMMSTPFIACVCDLLGTVIYVQVALLAIG